jgi:hypothetical protein
MNNNYYTINPNEEFQTTANSLWQPDAQANQKILIDTGIKSNSQYRQYMMKNANQIMKYNTMESIYNSGNNPYTNTNNESLNKSPYLYTSVHNTSSPIYGFSNSDLKQDYITNEQMKSRMIAPTIPTNF